MIKNTVYCFHLLTKAVNAHRLLLLPSTVFQLNYTIQELKYKFIKMPITKSATK